MKFSNEWVTYLDRGYNRVRDALIARLKIRVPEITDFSENHILIVIIEMFAGISEQINAYIDNLSRESFLSTARRFSSVLKHTRAYDYHIKSRIPASVDLTFYLENSDGSIPSNLNQQEIPIGTIVEAGAVKFITIDQGYIPAGSTEVKVPAYQQESITNDNIGRTNGFANQVLNLPANISEGTLQLVIDGRIFIFKETLARSDYMDAHFTTTLRVDKTPVVLFGNGVQGVIPNRDKDVIATYKTTLGAEGNEVQALTIDTIVSPVTLTGLSNDVLKVKNELAPTGGSGVESMESARKNAVLSLRTLEYAVTESDHEDIAKLAPGVADAVLRYTHPRYLEIFISPLNGGAATSALIQSTHDYIFSRRLLGRNITVKSAGQTEILLSFTLATKFRHDATTNTNEVALALLDFYSAQKSNINRAIRYSDIISIVENNPSTDYVTITKLSTKPLPKPLGNNTKDLIATTLEVLPTSTQRAAWRISYAGTQWVLYRDGKAQLAISFDTEYTSSDGSLKLRIPDGAYDTGDTWEFNTYPYNNDMEINDYTLPVLSVNNLNIHNVEKIV